MMSVLLREDSMKTLLLLFTGTTQLHTDCAEPTLLLTAGSVPRRLELMHRTCTHPAIHFHKKRILGLIWHLEAQCLIYSNLHIKIYKTGCVDKRSGTISSFLMNVDQQSSRPKLLVVSMRFQVAAEVLV